MKILAIGLVIGFIVFASFKMDEGAASELPNIVYILLDDSEYVDIGAYGSEIRTPHIDSLAANGVMFESFYNNAVCSPSRATALTGMFPQRVGLSNLSHRVTTHPAQLGHINLNFTTLTEYLKNIGYETAMSGKWHLGKNDHPSQPFENASGLSAFEPYDRGFDHWSGIIGSENDLYSNTTDTWLEDGVPVTNFTGFYGTDFIGDKAVEYVNQMTAPWFLYNPHVAPHHPHRVPLDPTIYDYYFNKFSALDTLSDLCYLYNDRLFEAGLIGCKTAHRFNEREIVDSQNSSDSRVDNIERYATHCAMVESVDIQVGKLVAALKAKGEMDNTIFVITSDNGADGSGINYIYNCPFKGWKPWAHTEGAVKSYGIWHWGNKLNNGITKQKAGLIDIFPTLDDIITDFTKQTEIDSFDGLSLKNSLLYGQQFPREICINYRDRASIYSEDCIKYEYNYGRPNPIETLYNYRCDGYSDTGMHSEITDSLLPEFREKFNQFAIYVNLITIAEGDAWRDCYPLSYNSVTQQCE